MRVHREHLRRHAHRHHEAHLRLKELLRHAPPKEKVWGVFVTTFAITLISLTLYSNWGFIREAFTPEPLLPPPPPPKCMALKQAPWLRLKSMLKEIGIIGIGLPPSQPLEVWWG